jgi:hypothetical protein
VADADLAAQFSLFGFVVLRRWLDPDEVRALSEEVDRELRLGFGAKLDERPQHGGIEGHYLPMLRPSAPLTCTLVEDDRLAGMASRFLDGGVLINPVEVQAVLYYSDAGWHNDDGYGVHGVKFAAYLDPLDSPGNALRMLPLSHRADQRALSGWMQHPRVSIDEVPCVLVHIEPGDVVAFDVHTWHANPGSTARRQWTVTYLRDPTTEPEERAVRATLAEGPEYELCPFPAGYRWVDHDWLADVIPCVRKAEWIRRLGELTTLPD